METKLGMGKVYLKAQDIGKMLKLKDVENLVITNVNIKDSKDLEIEIATPICNKTNNRIRDFKGNKAYHVGLDYRRDINKISVSIFEKNEKKYKLLVLKWLNKVEDIVDILNNLDNSVFYIDQRGFGVMLYDKLIALGIKPNKIVASKTDVLKIRKEKLLETIQCVDFNWNLEGKRITLLREINSLKESHCIGGIKYINDNPSSYLDVLFIPLIDNIN